MARKRAAGKVTGSQGDAAIDTWMDFNCQIVLVFQLNISFYIPVYLGELYPMIYGGSV
ncbi:hypothetical protein N9X05_15860 [Paracoccaceae bacterium]|nr:hypothetical protein [Paracoccaceae bacterium]